jgi:hypothetical protein
MKLIGLTNKEINLLTNYKFSLEKSRIKNFKEAFLIFTSCGLIGLLLASYKSGFN